MDKEVKLAEVVQDKYYTLQYRVKYPDGTLSEDYYNLTRAKDHAKTINDKAKRLLKDEQDPESKLERSSFEEQDSSSNVLS